MDLVAASFAWPFRGEWRSRWLIGLTMVVLLPIAFIPLLGYAVAATRAAAIDPGAGLPRWAPSRRLLADGFWVALAIALIAAPFALALGPLSRLIDRAHSVASQPTPTCPGSTRSSPQSSSSRSRGGLSCSC